MIKLTEKEYKKIIDELADRVQDVVFMNYRRMMKKTFSRRDIQGFLNCKDFDLEVDYKFVFLINDFRQIYGRIKKGGKKK